jgi:hypothetical protein
VTAADDESFLARGREGDPQLTADIPRAGSFERTGAIHSSSVTIRALSERSVRHSDGRVIGVNARWPVLSPDGSLTVADRYVVTGPGGREALERFVGEWPGTDDVVGRVCKSDLSLPRTWYRRGKIGSMLCFRQCQDPGAGKT